MRNLLAEKEHRKTVKNPSRLNDEMETFARKQCNYSAARNKSQESYTTTPVGVTNTNVSDACQWL